MGGLHYASGAMAKTDSVNTPPDRLTEHLRRQFRIKWKTAQAKQVAMAEAIGKEQSTVSKFLGNEHDLSLDSLDRLARFFGTTLADMLSDAPRPPESPFLTRLRVVLFAQPESERDEFVRPCERMGGMFARPDTVVAPTPPTTPRTRKTARAK